MTRVIVSEDCGNSPKNLFVQDFSIALASGDIQFILDRVSEDIRWNQIGRAPVQGKAEFILALDAVKKERVEEITVRHAFTHGKAGAVNGTLKMEHGGIREFCHIFEFSGAKGTSIEEITSYELQGD